MRCRINECCGDYVEKNITHTIKPQGKIVIIIDNVLANVCSSCKDTLFSLPTIKKIEEKMDKIRE